MMEKMQSLSFVLTSCKLVHTTISITKKLTVSCILFFTNFTVNQLFWFRVQPWSSVQICIHISITMYTYSYYNNKLLKYLKSYNLVIYFPSFLAKNFFFEFEGSVVSWIFKHIKVIYVRNMKQYFNCSFNSFLCIFF